MYSIVLFPYLWLGHSCKEFTNKSPWLFFFLYAGPVLAFQFLEHTDYTIIASLIFLEFDLSFALELLPTLLPIVATMFSTLAMIFFLFCSFLLEFNEIWIIIPRIEIIDPIKMDKKLHSFSLSTIILYFSKQLY